MNAQIELMDHNQRNIGMFARLLGKKLTPAHIALLARFRTMLVKQVPVASANANPETAQHEAANLLAGELAEERKLMLFARQVEVESFA